MNVAVSTPTWTPICHVAEVPPHFGVCALVGTRQIAVFYLPQQGNEWFAIDNYDPLGQAFVLSRGIVGDVNGEWVVASPLYKQHFSLVTGQCLEQPEHAVQTYAVRVVDQIVEIAVP